jgi:hypothetical protein
VRKSLVRPSTNFAAKRLLYPAAPCPYPKGVIRLFDAGSEGNADQGNRIECASCSEREFLLRSERGSVINVACVEVWDDADQTLLFLSFYLLSGDQIGGTADSTLMADLSLPMLPRRGLSAFE